MRVKYLPQDNEARLHGGICFYRGKPYSLTLQSQSVANLSSIYSKAKVESFNVALNDQELDISSPKLGYCNHNKQAVYVMRKPERKYKQLLNAGSLTGQVVLSNQLYSGGDINNLLHSSAGEKMLLGEYPNCKEAMEKLRSGKIESIAISRNIGLAMDSYGIIHVFYKLDEVGLIKPNTNVVLVPKGEVAWVVSKYLDGFDWKVE